jgi:hypothetical protein
MHCHARISVIAVLVVMDIGQANSMVRALPIWMAPPSWRGGDAGRNASSGGTSFAMRRIRSVVAAPRAPRVSCTTGRPYRVYSPILTPSQLQTLRHTRLHVLIYRCTLDISTIARAVYLRYAVELGCKADHV